VKEHSKYRASAPWKVKGTREEVRSEKGETKKSAKQHRD
jgi:hypothetical protein